MTSPKASSVSEHLENLGFSVNIMKFSRRVRWYVCMRGSRNEPVCVLSIVSGSVQWFYFIFGIRTAARFIIDTPALQPSNKLSFAYDAEYVNLYINEERPLEIMMRNVYWIIIILKCLVFSTYSNRTILLNNDQCVNTIEKGMTDQTFI